MVMGLAEFQEIFTPDLRDFAVTAIREGVAESLNPDFYPTITRNRQSARSVASIRSDHINYHARRLVFETPGLGLVEHTKGDRTFYIARDRIVLWFKKLDADLRPRSNETKPSQSFLSQMSPLPNLGTAEEATNVIAGYTLNALETSMQIHLTCPLDETNLWVWKLWAKEDQANLFEMTSMNPPAQLPAGPQPRIAQLKDEAKKGRASNGTQQ